MKTNMRAPTLVDEYAGSKQIHSQIYTYCIVNTKHTEEQKVQEKVHAVRVKPQKGSAR